MARHGYRIFSEGKIGHLTLSNRLVRSATWDPSILPARRMTDEVIGLYRQVALGGVGLVITGDFPVVPAGRLDGGNGDAEIAGLDRLVDAVHDAAPGCRIVAQLEAGYPGVGPSAITSPFWDESVRPLSVAQIRVVVDCFVSSIVQMREIGFDGVQLHAAHGGLLSCFLSPYTNRRDDEYGGSARNRVRIVRDIVAGARERVGNWPILIKVNGTDYVVGGLDSDTFPGQVREIALAGVDAIEVSGGMWDCLARSQAELGFRPVPSPESHTRIHRPAQQSYFLPYAERLDLDVPVILVGGNRDVERLEAIVRRGVVDFIALGRPLISEPDLPRRWLEGRGSSGTDCISCNSCIHDLIVHPGQPTPGVVTCVYKHNQQQHRMAQRWLSSWVAENRVRPDPEASIE